MGRKPCDYYWQHIKCSLDAASLLHGQTVGRHVLSELGLELGRWPTLSTRAPGIWMSRCGNDPTSTMRSTWTMTLPPELCAANACSADVKGCISYPPLPWSKKNEV